MPEEGGWGVVVVSDLHLSAGYDPRRGTFARNEDFFADEAFGRFVDHLLARAEREGRRWRLVILGDLIDFLQIELADEGPGATASATSVRRLEVAAAGHPELFAALARFVAAGHRLEVVAGNHDVELVWPAVQARFRALVGEHGAGEGAAGIGIHPWVFYLPGVVYAEHGHQYDDVNSFLTPMAPFLPSDRDLIELPLGSFFVRYLFNQVERVDPFADNVKPATRYLRWALRNHPILALSTLDDHLRLMIGALRKTADLSDGERRARREAYHEAVVRPAAGAIGLPAETLVAIDELAAIPTMKNPWQQLKALLLEPLRPAAATLAGAAAAYAAAGRLPPAVRGLAPLAGAVAVRVWREREAVRPATAANAGLREVARAIDARLRAVGKEVPVYVFGHTHTAEFFPLGEEEGAPRYLNSGTWLPIVPTTDNLLGARERFSFVELTRDAGEGGVVSRLLVWNDAAERVERLPLFAGS